MSILKDASGSVTEFNSKHWLYRRYSGIKTRCYNPKVKEYKYYGGKGVIICSEWLSDPSAFAAWSIENGASPELQIDRIDGDGNYSPDNCRWVTRRANLRNRPPKSQWNWSDASRARYQDAIDDDEADLHEIGEEWAGKPMSDAARLRCVWPSGPAGDLPSATSMTARQWLIVRRWHLTILALVDDGLSLIDAIHEALDGMTDAEWFNYLSLKDKENDASNP